MRLLLLAELRKTALRPITGLLVCLFVIGTLAVTWTGQGFGHQQWTDAVNNYTFVLHAGECRGHLGADLKQCQADALAYDLPAARHLLSYARGIASAAAPGQTPVGAFGWAAGLFGSVPGLLAAFVLAAATVASEWERGTAGAMLLAENRLPRILMAKGVAIWSVLTVATLLAGASVLGYDEAYASRAYPLGSFAPGATGLLEYSLRRLIGTVLLLGLATSVAVLCAARWRTRGIVVPAGIMTALAANLGTMWPSVWSWLPGGVYADLMRFSTRNGIWDHFWGAAANSSGSSPMVLRTVVAALVVLALVAAVRGRGRGRRRTQDLI